MPPNPPNFWKSDKYGMAPIHLCAILDTITAPAVQNIIGTPLHPALPDPKLQNYMMLKTDGSKREIIAADIVNRYKDFATSRRDIAGPILPPTRLGMLNCWQLGQHFNTKPTYPFPPQSNVPAVVPRDSPPHLPTDARKALLIQYLPLAYQKALGFMAKYGKIKDPSESYESSAAIKLEKTVNAFDPTKGYSLVTYANRGFENWMLEQVGKIITQKKHMALTAAHRMSAPIYTNLKDNEICSASLDAPIKGKDGSLRPIHESIANPREQDPSLDLEDKLRKQFLEKAKMSLAHKERTIIELHFQGMRQNQIATIVGLKPPAIGESIRKIEAKIKRFIQKKANV